LQGLHAMRYARHDMNEEQSTNNIRRFEMQCDMN
jgi:hypothetical protein